MEITIKAWLAGGRINREMPATWTDRTAGTSKYRLWKWLPRYLRWYFYAVRYRFLSGKSATRIFRGTLGRLVSLKTPCDYSSASRSPTRRSRRSRRRCPEFDDGARAGAYYR